MATSDGFTAYDVVIVPFPYVDRLAERRRPALVISSAALARHGVLWVAMITSAANARNASLVAGRLAGFLAKKRAPAR
jgi:PemK-like protein.